MMMNVAVILIILGVGYMWAARGFFSSLLHMAAVLASGAIAFALWETCTNMLLGVGMDMISDNAWGWGLVLPFALSVAVIAGVLTAFVRANVQVTEVVNYIGGGLCGAVSGLVVAGIVALSLSYLRGGTEFMGTTPITYDRGSGALVRTNPLWVPADRIVAAMYAQFSKTTLRTATPLADHYPDLADRGYLTRMGPMGMLLKNSIKPGDAVLMGRYVVGDDKTPIPLKDLLSDSFNPGVTQKYRTIDGNDASGNYRIEGYVVGTRAGLKERVGQVAFGRGGVQLIVRQSDNTSVSLQPIAAVSQASGERAVFARWRYDGGEVYISSVGGAADPPFAFEFLVPQGAEPQALIVRNLRLDLIDPDKDAPKAPFATYATVAERDQAVRTGSLMTAAGGGGKLDRSQVVAYNSQGSGGGAASEFKVTNTLERKFTKGASPGIDITDQNVVTDGETAVAPGDLAQPGAERGLIIERLAVDSSTVIVQVDAGPNSPFSVLSPAAQNGDGAPALVDDNGQRFQAVGFLYEDTTGVKLRYTVGKPITSLSDLPSMSRSRTDQKLTLIFRPSLGVKIRGYAVGSKLCLDIKPSVPLDAPQK